MTKLLAASAAALTLFWAVPVCAADAKATEIAQSMMTAMGGVENWNRAHFVRYDFKVNVGDKTVVDRAHLWDKKTGRYRIESKTKDGKAAVMLFNAGTQQGAAYIDGKKLDGPAAAKAMKDAYGAFINDMYWLSMPWKWMDQGVHLKYMGQKTRAKNTYDVVELTFGKVGLTPGDRYDAYVSPQSHLMEHWEYRLQSGDKGSWDWEYTTVGGVKLARNHTSEGKSISMGDVQVMDKADDALFTDPAKMLR